VAVPHPPFASQTERLLPWHSVWLGAQMPLQAPLTHVWLVHASVGPHVPLGVHVCTPLLTVHCAAPGAHATHAPFQQTGVAPAHVVWLCHWPEALHSCTRLPTHCV
jgi:hypothetical protein